VEKIIAYWNIGKHIREHLLHYKDRAGYKEDLFNKLAEALTIGVRILYWTAQFHETYPSNLNPGSNLTWSHYRLLLTIKDENKRKEYEHIIETEGLSKRELEELIKIAILVSGLCKQARSMNLSYSANSSSKSS
ncbi:MAG: hypothetical protein JXJ04_15700, partial [Spirochaetales bacterium]|nr:hypothetical protein [Spirochaetales bacterium]